MFFPLPSSDTENSGDFTSPQVQPPTRVTDCLVGRGRSDNAVPTAKANFCRPLDGLSQARCRNSLTLCFTGPRPSANLCVALSLEPVLLN